MSENKNESNELETKAELTLKQKTFCENYVALGSDTFGNGTKSALAAGYSEKGAAQTGSVLLRNPKIQRKIQQLHTEYLAKLGVTKESVILDIQHDRNMAREQNQWGVAAQCDKLLGSILAMFSEKHVITPEEKPKPLTKSESEGLAEAARIYKLHLCGGNES